MLYLIRTIYLLLNQPSKLIGRSYSKITKISITRSNGELLKYGFCNKSFRKDEPLTGWTLFSTYLSSKLDSPLNKTLERIRFSSNQNIGEGESNFNDKYVEKSVQLVRGSSFWNDLLQNPYFNRNQEHNTGKITFTKSWSLKAIFKNDV